MPKITAIPATRNIRIPEAPLARRKVAGYARASTDSDEQFTSYETLTCCSTRVGHGDMTAISADGG